MSSEAASGHVSVKRSAGPVSSSGDDLDGDGEVDDRAAANGTELACVRRNPLHGDNSREAQSALHTSSKQE